MSIMHIKENLEERLIALGYTKRVQRIMFVTEAVLERIEREEK